MPQTALQQTVSTHLFEPHSALTAHAAPFGLRPDWQIPAASQYWAPPQGVVAFVSCAPGVTLTQLPSKPGTAHDWQVPVQVPLQQR